MSRRTGVHLPNHDPPRLGMRAMAALVEEAGFDSVWLSDHIVMPEGIRSRYPFSDDGVFFAKPEEDWLEWLTCAAYLAAATERVEIGVGVCVLPLREPLLLAKQVATLDRLSGGRAILGVGAGWMAEEFDALGVDFTTRGARMDEALQLLRRSWAGMPFPGVHSRPVPVRDPLPIYVGGDSPAALRRVAEYGDGWYGTASGGHMAAERIRDVRLGIARACERVERDPAEIEIALRVAVAGREIGTLELEERLRGYVAAGVGRLSFDIGWRDAAATRARLESLSETLRRL